MYLRMFLYILYKFFSSVEYATGGAVSVILHMKLRSFGDNESSPFDGDVLFGLENASFV